MREVKVKVQWNCRNGVEVCDNDTCIPLACAQIAVLIMLGLGEGIPLSCWFICRFV